MIDMCPYNPSICFYICINSWPFPGECILEGFVWVIQITRRQRKLTTIFSETICWRDDPRSGCDSWFCDHDYIILCFNQVHKHWGTFIHTYVHTYICSMHTCAYTCTYSYTGPPEATRASAMSLWIYLVCYLYICCIFIASSCYVGTRYWHSYIYSYI